MKEQKIKEYFEDTLSGEELDNDVEGSATKTSFDVTSINVESILDGKFEIELKHLFQLAKDVIAQKIKLTNLNLIAFALITSNAFFWNEETEEGKIIDEQIYSWDEPDLTFLQLENFLLNQPIK